MFDMTISAASSTGCVREHNEDMLLVGDRFVRDDKIEMQVSLTVSTAICWPWPTAWVAIGVATWPAAKCYTTCSSSSATSLHSSLRVA